MIHRRSAISVCGVYKSADINRLKALIVKDGGNKYRDSHFHNLDCQGSTSVQMLF